MMVTWLLLLLIIIGDTFMIHSIWILFVLYHILTYLLFFEHYYHYTIYAIILISLHRIAGPFTLSLSFYSQYNCHLQYRYNYDCLCSWFNSIAYFANNADKHRVFVIAIHPCKCNILILGIILSGLSHRYTIQNNTGWLLVIVLHLVDRLVQYHSYFTQYSYYRDYFCLGTASHLCDCHSHV